MRELRRGIQVIFQDPYSSLNPRMTVGQIIGEPLRVYGLVKDQKDEHERVAELLGQVGLCSTTWRSAIRISCRAGSASASASRARSRSSRASSSATSRCRRSTSRSRARSSTCSKTCRTRLNLSYLFIAHDLAVVRHISDRVAVMYLGRIAEVADRDELYADPKHPYTKALLDAAPIPDPRVERARAPRALKGEIPSPLNPPSGCVFHTRCPIADEECRREIPQVRQIGPRHIVACHKA